jgi:transposase-like protein
MARKGYPAEFRRRALDLVAAGKPVAEVARLLEVSDQSIYSWRRSRRRPAGAGSRASSSVTGLRCTSSTPVAQVRCKGGSGGRRRIASRSAGWRCCMPGSCSRRASRGRRRRRSSACVIRHGCARRLPVERTGWAQRLHALLRHEGWPCPRGRLLTSEGRRWIDGLELVPASGCRST